jgi:hypothetical protein
MKSALGAVAVGLYPELQWLPGFMTRRVHLELQQLPGVKTIESVLGVATERYCSHCEDLHPLYYSCVEILEHESSKFLYEICKNRVKMAYGERFVH